MQATLELLNGIIQFEHHKLTLEQIALQYRDGLNPSLFALAFQKTHKLVIQLSKNYYGLSEEDLVSYALEKLDFCLQTFDGQSKIKFSTYFFTVLKNKYREETQYLTTQKRKIIFNQISYCQALEKGFDVPIMPYYDEIADIIQKLSFREKQYCELILQDFSNKEIAEILQTSIMTLCNLRKGLRLKFLDLGIL